MDKYLQQIYLYYLTWVNGLNKEPRIYKIGWLEIEKFYD